MLLKLWRMVDATSPMNSRGESILTVGRAVQFARHGAALVVNCAPFGCMPGNMAGGILHAVQKNVGVPMVSLFYDGEGDINTRLETFLANLPAKEGELSGSEQPL